MRNYVHYSRTYLFASRFLHGFPHVYCIVSYSARLDNRGILDWSDRLNIEHALSPLLCSLLLGSLDFLCCLFLFGYWRYFFSDP